MLLKLDNSNIVVYENIGFASVAVNSARDEPKSYGVVVGLKDGQRIFIECENELEGQKIIDKIANPS